jgi:hypothetical protein
MKSHRKKAILVGILYILGIVAGILSIDPVIDASDYLLKVSANSTQITLRAIFQFTIAVIYASVPIILYPVLSRFNKSLTAGFLIFRVIAVVFIFIGWASILLLLALCQEAVKASPADLTYFQNIGNLIRTGRDIINHMTMPLILSVGNLLFYYLLYKIKLVPGWLSVWGFIATVFSGIIASLLLMFHFIDIITPAYVALTLPTAVLEITLAIWLIARGFDTRVLNTIGEDK